MQVFAKAALSLVLAAALLICCCFGIINALWSCEAYMRSEFIRTDAPFFTGISIDGLVKVDSCVRSFIKGRAEALDVSAEIKGEEREVFSSEEKAHLEDVKRLYGNMRIAAFSLGIFLVIFLSTCSKYDKNFMPDVVKSAAVTAFFLPLVIAACFNEAFVLFHKVFFPGGNWRFDIEKSVMVNIYTEAFFERFCILMSLGNAAICLVLFFLALRKSRRIGYGKKNG